MLDGEPAAVGAVVTATNQDGEAVGSTIAADGWFIEVEPGRRGKRHLQHRRLGPE